MKKSDYNLANNWWELKIQNEDDGNYIYELRSKKNNVIYADQDYHYRLITSKKRGSRYLYLDHLGSEYKAKNLVERKILLVDKEKLIIEGTFRDTEIRITHEFELKENSKWLNERITLNNLGTKRVRLGLINFGFKKAFFCQYKGWKDNLDEYKLSFHPLY